MNNCLKCNKETTNNKFCSKSCSAKFNNKISKRKRKTLCKRCSNITKSYRHTLCEFHHQQYIETRFDYIKELTLGDYWTKKSLVNLHPSSKNAHIRGLARSWFKDLTLKPCHNCGYSKHVELCHIKPINEFLSTNFIKDVNNRNNIIQLCPNCHWEFDNNLLKLTI